MAPLLEIEGLQTHIRLKQAVVRPVDGVSLHVDQGETLGIVGESGCGKTMTALSIMNLLPVGGHIVGGSIRLDGTEISGLDDEAMRQVRGNEIGMIFQDPLTSLNPTMTVGKQIAETVLLHRAVSHAQAMDRAVGGAGPGRNAEGQGAGRGVPAPVLRRDAAAGDDRDGAGLRAEAADRR